MKKTCSKCGEEKELELFVKCKDCLDGYRSSCNECFNAYMRKYNEINKCKVLKINRKSYYKTKLKNPELLKIKRKKSNDKRKTDIFLKLSTNISNSIRKSIYNNGFKKHTKTHKILGCSSDKFKRHLESQFQEGMTWDNYGRNGWHIDHIYPVSKARDEEHLLELNHYTNLQPLWEKDNIAKGNRLDWSK
jgi:hypothetical protein